MKKIYIITLLLLAGVFAQAQTSVWDGSRKMWNRGAGTQDDPILIESAENLAFLSYMVGKGYDTQGLYFKLTTDIDLNGSEYQQWIPIGLLNEGYDEDGCPRNALPTCVSAQDVVFKGHFDGGDHSIANIYVNKENGAAGLFGVVSATEENPVVVENVYVTSGFIKGYISGGLVGTYQSQNSGEILISRCWNGAEVQGRNAGGIVGEKASQVRNCYNVGEVNGSYSAGGIVGSMANEVEECYNNGAVTSGFMAGGIMGGVLNGDASVRNCYNTGNVSSSGANAPASLPGNFVGGIVGFIWNGEHTMSNCYNVGLVSSDIREPGGLVGNFGNSGIVENAYYLNTCGGEGEGESKTADEMRAPSFVDVLNNGANVWCADTLSVNGGYPILGANNLAVDEHALNKLVVYPNPNHGRFTVEGTGVLTVFNMLGQTILTQKVDGKVAMELPQGMYVVRLEGASGIRIAKMLVR